jgi:RNA polymerase sigma-70 factor (ECF subfamily)
MVDDINGETGNTENSSTISLDALRAGDRAEFGKVVEMYSAKIYRLALRMMGNPQDAEDVLQETFLKAYRGISGFGGRSSVGTWLYRIATNEALMTLRRKQPHFISIDESVTSEEDIQEPVQIIDWCCLPEDELMSSEARMYLDAAVDRLPQSLRVVFLLRDMDEFSTQEAAEVLGLSETAVKTRLSRARMRLREDLSSYYHAKREAGKTYATQ